MTDVDFFVLLVGLIGLIVVAFLLGGWPIGLIVLFSLMIFLAVTA